ncbi:location of vulva defective 1-like [Acanthaster planci]|uniref:Location of vulva defective 1-like n=1 Tax=Acanthaster planci TaxID=133434 RepID=A0A8B7Y553_ACAPL|nr:location of vulva defective 1-like [Acanthaster planci]
MAISSKTVVALLCVFTSARLIVCQVSQIQHHFTMQQNSRLTGSAFTERSAVGSAVRCSALCSQHSHCVSFNYAKNLRLCELNRNTSRSDPEKLETDDRFKYYEIMNQKTEDLKTAFSTTIMQTTTEQITKPATTEPATMDLTTTEQTTIEPTIIEPSTVEPTTTQPTTTKPATTEPTTREPTTTKSTSVEATTTVVQSSVEPSTMVPTTTEPTTVEARSTEATTIEPTTMQPTTMEPTTEPATTKPTTSEPTTKEPTTEPTTMEQTTAEPSTIEQTTDGSVIPTGMIRESCSALRQAGYTTDGYYMIDPDGIGTGEEPFRVHCSSMAAIGWTTVDHTTSGQSLNVTSNPYDVTISYYANQDQIEALMAVSMSCNQFLKAECWNAKLWDGIDQLAWWESAQGGQMSNWAGEATGNEGCRCFSTGTCAGGNAASRCNCGGLSDTWTKDDGRLNDLSRLPVVALHFEQVTPPSSQIIYKLDALRCYTKFP